MADNKIRFTIGTKYDGEGANKFNGWLKDNQKELQSAKRGLGDLTSAFSSISPEAASAVSGVTKFTEAFVSGGVVGGIIATAIQGVSFAIEKFSKIISEAEERTRELAKAMNDQLVGGIKSGVSNFKEWASSVAGYKKEVQDVVNVLNGQQAHEANMKLHQMTVERLQTATEDLASVAGNAMDAFVRAQREQMKVAESSERLAKATDKSCVLSEEQRKAYKAAADALVEDTGIAGEEMRVQSGQVREMTIEQAKAAGVYREVTPFIKEYVTSMLSMATEEQKASISYVAGLYETAAKLEDVDKERAAAAEAERQIYEKSQTHLSIMSDLTKAREKLIAIDDETKRASLVNNEAAIRRANKITEMENAETALFEQAKTAEEIANKAKTMRADAEAKYAILVDDSSVSAEQVNAARAAVADALAAEHSAMLSANEASAKYEEQRAKIEEEKAAAEIAQTEALAALNLKLQEQESVKQEIIDLEGKDHKEQLDALKEAMKEQLLAKMRLAEAENEAADLAEELNEKQKTSGGKKEQNVNVNTSTSVHLDPAPNELQDIDKPKELDESQAQSFKEKLNEQKDEMRQQRNTLTELKAEFGRELTTVISRIQGANSWTSDIERKQIDYYKETVIPKLTEQYGEEMVRRLVTDSAHHVLLPADMALLLGKNSPLYKLLENLGLK